MTWTYGRGAIRMGQFFIWQAKITGSQEGRCFYYIGLSKTTCLCDRIYTTFWGIPSSFQVPPFPVPIEGRVTSTPFFFNGMVISHSTHNQDCLHLCMHTLCAECKQVVNKKQKLADPVLVWVKCLDNRSTKRRIAPRIHPWKLTWNLNITKLKRNIIFQTSIFGFNMLIFQGLFKQGIPFFGHDGHCHCPSSGSKCRASIQRWYFPTTSWRCRFVRERGYSINQRDPLVWGRKRHGCF